MIYVNRKEHFNAAHKLYNPNWSDDKNREVFGVCANANWHGHNFDLVVTVKGEIDDETGYVMDMKLLSDLMKHHIIDKVDHKNLNLDVDFMTGIMTSCENIITEFWKILYPIIESETDGKAELHRIRLYETRNNFVEYKG